MNTIEVQSVLTPNGYSENYIVVDGKVITDYIDEYADDDLQKFGSLQGLYPAWGDKLLYEGEKRFVKELLQSDEQTILPVLVCEDDLDLSCLVIVVAVRKDKDCVYYDKIGYVLHHENLEEELESGILNLESYSQEDREKYGENIALEKVNSHKWQEWISENWDEELYRRRMNYTLPYYMMEGNVQLIKDINWIFDRNEYTKIIHWYEGK